MLAMTSMEIMWEETKLKKFLQILFSLLSVVMVALLLMHQSQSYCENLVEVSKRAGVEKALKGWVVDNLVNKQISKNDILGGGGMWPGMFGLKPEKADFDWSFLGFESHSQIRLVGLRARDILDGNLHEIKSVFFGEQSRHGILVRYPGSNEFGVDEAYLTRISSDIAVVCREGD